MCNLSESFIERGIQRGIDQERTKAIERMLTAGATKEQILSYGYTDEELTKAGNILYAPT